MAKITVLVCDECGTQDDVLHFDIRQGDRRALVDLCVEHAEVFETCLKKSGVKSPARKPRAPRARTKRVTTMEEIEELKAK